MSRITVIENATIRTEVVSPRITVNWNPRDDSGVVVFDTAAEESINGEFTRLIAGEAIAVTLDDLAQRVVVVEGVEIPFSTVMAYTKQLFDDLIAERSAE